MTKPVPMLITWDIDPYSRRDVDRKRRVLRIALEVCQEFNAAATFFFVAQEAKWYADEIAEAKRAGHEIGCHGLTHGDEEEYNRMPLDMQRDYVGRATHLLEDQTGMPVTAFRGPRVKISPTTLGVLVEHGYLTDSSVCSQRLDLVSSNLLNPRWLIAPRIPYHPHCQSAFRRGKLNILEVPISALLIPFISSALYVLRLSIIKALFRLLYLEARRVTKPIVYLAHPAEFGSSSHTRLASMMSLKSLRTHGLLLRERLREPSPDRRLSLNRELIAYTASFPAVRFMTMRDYAHEFGAAATAM